MANGYVVIYTKENGKQELAWTNWIGVSSLTYHREDGPAIATTRSRAWYLDNQLLTEKEHAQLIQEVRNMPEVLRLVDPRWWVREFK